MSTEPNDNNNTGSAVKDFARFFLTRGFAYAVLLCYAVLILVLLLAEMDIEMFAPYRATDKVLMLLGLFFLPFFILAAPKLVSTLTFRVGGGKEIQVELNQVRDHIHTKVIEVQSSIAQQISSAEESLWPMLAGNNPLAEQRLSGARPQLIIGSKQDTSHEFFANFLKAWIELHLPQVDCQLRLPNGGSQKNFADVKHRWVDLYIDFTGTCAQFFSIDHQFKSEQQMIAELNRYCQPLGITCLPSLGATEDYCLVMPRDKAEELDINNLSELALAAESLVFTADPEFLNRRDCWVGLQQRYGLKFARVEPCEITERFALLEGNRAQVFVGYETDPEIKQHNLRVLRDDEQFFPGYAAFPLISSAALEKIAGLQQVLEQLAGQFTTEDLIQAVHKLRVSNSSKSTVDSLTSGHCRRIQSRAEST